MRKGEAGPIHLGGWEEDEAKNQARDERKAKRERAMTKASDAKSTMFEYGTKEQQEAELKKPTNLPQLVVKERSPKKPFPAPAMTGEKEPTSPSLDAFVEKWSSAKQRAAVKALVIKAKVKHLGTRHGTKDPKGSLERIQRFKTDEGDVIKPPKKKAKRKEMASEMIAHHHHHLGRHPGGRAQAIAIGLNQAGMSRAEKAMNKSPVPPEVEGATPKTHPGAKKDWLGFTQYAKPGETFSGKPAPKTLKERIESLGKYSPTRERLEQQAKQQEETKKGDPGGMSGYEKGVEMYGKEGMQKMATQHMTAGEMKDKATPIHLPAAKSVEDKDKGARLMPDVGPALKALKALGKQEGEEFVPKDSPEKSMNKQVGGGPSVGGGVASTGMGGAGVGSPSIGVGNKSVEKGTGDQEKAYLGEWTPQGFTGSGAAPKGYKPGSGQSVGEEAAEKMSPSDPKKVTSMGGPQMKVSGAKPAAKPEKITVATSGGGKTNGGVLTSAGASPPPVPKEAGPSASLKPGSTLSMTSVAGDKAKKVASVNKGQEIKAGTVVPMSALGFGKSLKEWMMKQTGIDDLMDKSVACHGGKGPAKTGAGTPHHPNRGPTKTGAGTPHPPDKGPHKTGSGEEEHGGKGKAKTGAGPAHPPNKGPAKTGAGPEHSPAREGMQKAMSARSVPRMSRGMAASMDTWRNATAVLTRTNAMLAPQPVQIGEMEPMVDAGGRPSTHQEVYKSDLSNCEMCGRTFSKSHGDCPTCSMNKALTCKGCGGHMVKGHGGMTCSACGMPSAS